MYHNKKDETFSGLMYELKFTRDPKFFLMGYILPSILFVFIAYSSLYINKEAVPARVSIAIIAVLITLSLNNSVQAQIP